MRAGPLVATVIGGLALVLPASAIFWVGYPRPWAPLPLVLVLPAFNELDWLSLLIPTIGFWTLGWKLFRGETRVGWWATSLISLVALLNAVYLVQGWSYGIDWQGPLHAWIVALVSLAFYVLLGGIAVRVHRRPSFGAAFSFYWLTFLWLGWYSFPYLGELP